MNSTLTRFLAIAIGLVLVGDLIAISGQSKDTDRRPRAATPTPLATATARQGGITCPPSPRISIPSWYPKDLSLPAGTYALRVSLPRVADYHRVALAVPTSLRDFAAFIAKQWPVNGWVFTRAEVESGDAEAQVTKPSSSSERTAAAIVARSVCNDSRVFLYLTYGTVRPTFPTPTPLKS